MPRNIAMSFLSQKNPNPQGKGMVPVLAHWRETRPHSVGAKSPAQLLLDWFNSALVLSAQFHFRPVAGQDYYLYLKDGAWRLSLISPGEWQGRDVGDCLGRCHLRGDMTWSITASTGLEDCPSLVRALSELAEAFLSALDTDEAVAEQLPAYRRDLPYFRRLLATGLGSSLRKSLSEAGGEGIAARTLRDAGSELLLPGWRGVGSA